MIEKEFPSDSSLEKAILGAILWDGREPNSCLLEATESLKVDDFSLDSHRRIYSVMLELGAKDVPITYQSIHDALKEHKAVETVGGVAYITDLTHGSLPVRTIRHYCDSLIKISAKRKMLYALEVATHQAYEFISDPGDIAATMQEQFSAIVERQQNKNCAAVSSFADDMCRRMVADFDAGGKQVGLPSGIRRLDAALGGFVRGENVVVAGYTGTGKTAFALNVVEKNCSNDVPSTFYSFEVDRDTLLIRLACKRLEIPQIKIRNKTLAREDLFRIVAEIQEIKRWPLWIDDRSILTPRELYASARMQASRGTRLFVTDHLHLFAQNCKGHTLREQCNEASATIRAMGKDSRVPVLNLCQLSRPEDKRTPSKPTLYDLKESGNIENDSHSVVMLWREMVEEDNRIRSTGNDAVLLRKNRNGPLLEIAAHFNGELMYWEEESPYLPAYEEKMEAARA